MVSYLVRLVRVGLAFLPFLTAFLRDRRRFVLFGRSRTLTDEQR